ncbi:MAG: putative C-S lyase [Bacteroidia bacterium]|nr:putative C-S lyase [Bacteroidia bacterium]
MEYNFDEIINREGTACVKYDFKKKQYGSEDILPMWVADMDFKTPDFIIDAIKKRAEHPVLGYSFHPDSFYESVMAWLQKRHGWTVAKEWLRFSPGIVPALNMCVRALTSPGDKIIVQPPVYFPFFSAISENQRIIVENPLLLKNRRFYMDYNNLEQIIDDKVKMIFLCSPHNPGGMVWSKEELIKLAVICQRHNILILSDEIHSDLVFNPYKHIPMALISDLVAQCTITCIAPSKTFNTAGLFTSVLIIPDETLRLKYTVQLEKLHIGWGNIFGTIAFEAAYKYGELWLEQLLDYLKNNIDFVIDYCKTYIPKIKVMKPEATYLLWLDFSVFGIEDDKLRDILLNDAKLDLSHGPIFGTGGMGFQRMNIACPRSILAEAMNRLNKVFGK